MSGAAGGTATISAARRREVIDALRRGTVSQAGPGRFTTGPDRFMGELDDELAVVARGGVAVRGENGAGRTFSARWLGERAKRAGSAVAEIQISETDTPLHSLETLHRRPTERHTTTHPASALRPVVDLWSHTLAEEVLDAGKAAEDDHDAVEGAVDELMEQRLAAVARTTPAFAAALRIYQQAPAAGDTATTEALIAWPDGQKPALARRAAGVGLNALRQLLDEVDGGRFPGLFLLIMDTPAFSDGQESVQQLLPLAQRPAIDFTTDPRRDRALTIAAGELNETERNAAAASASDVTLDIP
ncbi:BREX system ATP-binding domain-containing protein [Actinomadura miaoliensis]|uniref:ATP-binding protein n=1 Tax=Actinomadura miaoliensis TaxID=430685 RepID=A0ABP7W555_9ACTN